MKLILLLFMLISLKSANGCSSSIMKDIDCFFEGQKSVSFGCDRNLAYENLRHYDEDSEPTNNDAALRDLHPRIDRVILARRRVGSGAAGEALAP